MNLDEIRKNITQIDKELINLFEKRMDLAKAVAQYKKEHQLPIYQEDREKDILDAGVKRLKNKEYSKYLKTFLLNTMEISRALQKETMIQDQELTFLDQLCITKDCKIGFQGVKGSYSYEALEAFFQSQPKQLVPCNEFQDVFESLKNKEIDYGIIPLENSSTGGISDTYDLLRKYKSYIVGEHILRIDHHLVGCEACSLDKIKEVYSHPQAFQQSQTFFEQHPDWKQIPFLNTAVSAKMVKEQNDPQIAAVASGKAAAIYNLKILKKNIQTNRDNYTRFVIISRESEFVKTSDKISLVFSLTHKSGTLYHILGYFAEAGINLLKIESRPIWHKPWAYYFYLDCSGSLTEEKVKDVLEKVAQEASYFQFLGNYQAAKTWQEV